MSMLEMCAACGRYAARPGKLLCEYCATAMAVLEAERAVRGDPGALVQPRRPLALALASIGVAFACAGPVLVPCSANDVKGQAALAANAAKCEAEYERCATSVCVDDVRAACDAEAERICK